MHEDTGSLIRSGMQCLQQSMYPQAEQAFRKVLARQPSHAPALHLLGLVYLQCGLLDAALEMVQMAVDNDGRQAPFQANLAVILKRLGEAAQEEAASAADSEACSRRAEAYFDRALKHLDRAVRLSPDFANAHFNRGKLLNQRGRMKDALQAMRKVVKLAPQTYEAWNEIGGMMLKTGELAQAREAYLRAADSPDDGHKAYSNYLLSLNYDVNDPQEVWRAHREWQVRYADPQAVFRNHANSPDACRRLKIGYVSADLHAHSVAYFAAPLIEQHRRDDFHITCYSDFRKDDAMQQRIRRAADVWVESDAMADEQLAARIRADGIDILVDLGGHTAGNRMRMFAMHPAPVQVAYIGYPNTSGLSGMDYRLTDALADPEGSDRFYTEQLLRLPGGFLRYSPSGLAQACASQPRGESDSKATVFGCFNVLPKVSGESIDMWAAILHAVPQASLVIKNVSMLDAAARTRLIAAFGKRGISARRLELIGWQASLKDHYRLYQRIDIALDTFPYNGTTTSCEALYMGTPVITLSGAVHAARVGESLLARVGMTELVAHSAQEYVRIAAGLAGDVQQRKVMSGRASDEARRVLCDATGLVREVEDAFRGIWRKWCGSGNKA